MRRKGDTLSKGGMEAALEEAEEAGRRAARAGTRARRDGGWTCSCCCGREARSAAASAGARARMDEPVRRLLLALVGAVSLTAERADELADSLAERGGMSKEEVRALDRRSDGAVAR